MGLNTNITILNDHINEICKDPAKWWDNVYNQICSTRARNENFCNNTTVNSVEHADTTTILAVGGNCTTVLGHDFGVHHHTEEGQITILKTLADRLGYRLVKKTKKKSK